MTVRISQPNSPLFPIARDRAGFDEMRLVEAARYEDMLEEGVPLFESINVEDGQITHVLAVDGEAVQIELLDGPHVGDTAWIRRDALAPAR